MEALSRMMIAIPQMICTVAIDYRLSNRVLGVRHSKMLTFCIMLIIQLFAGWLNLRLNLATEVWSSTLYYGTMSMGLYMVLFKGSIIKKLFLVVLIWCGLPISFYFFLPFTTYFFGNTTAGFLRALQVVEYINILLYAVGTEYIGKRFQNLRRELPAGYTVYLTAVILFVHVAIYSAYDQILIKNNAVVSLSAAFTSTIFAAAGMTIVIIAIFAVDRQVTAYLKEQLLLMKAENFRSRELEWRRFSGFRHDIKNHLICLNNLLKNGKTEQALCYMRNLTDTVKQFDDPVQTGNDYADALLSAKYAEAVAAKINLSMDMAIPPQGFIEPVDLCCILSNALDNAITACGQLTDDEKWITARAFIKQGQFIIVIKNSKPSYVTVVNNEVYPKEITADHGLGLDTVKAVVDKYGGTLHLSADGYFSFSVLLP